MTTKNFFLATLLWCLIGVITAVLETPWNLGAVAIPKHQVSRTRRLVALDDNSAPYVRTATLSPDASYLILAFDQPTNQGGYTSSFPCTEYFTFPAVEVATCSWQDSETVTIYPNLSPQYVSQAFTLGSSLTLNGNKGTFSAACVASSARSSCLPLGIQTIPIIATTPVIPVVSVVTAPSISACLDWTLSLTGSTGDGHRGWNSASYIKVTGKLSGNTIDTKSLGDFLTASLSTLTPIVVPKSYLTIGATYTISVHLCNILGGCGDGGATVQVNSGSKSAPSVSLTGPATSSFYSSNALSVTAVAGVTSCDGTTTSVGLKYDWTVTTVSSGQAVKFTNTRQNQVNVAQNTLIPGQQYTVAVTVTDSGSKLSSTSSVTVSVSKSPLVAAISPSVMQLFRVDATSQLVLNGKGSYDPDDPKGQTPLTYTWSCASQGSSRCALNTGSTTDSTLTVTGSDSSMVGSVSTFTLTVSKDTRTASATVVVKAIAGSAPVVSITSAQASLTQIDTTTPVLIGAAVTTSLSVGCAWTTDAGSAFDITKSSTPLTKTLPVGSTIYSLYLPGNLLPIRATYHFTLTCSSSAATVTVTTNGPPVPGSFSITPTTGTEMNTPFAFTASSWTDPDLPITYLFGFRDVLSGEVKSVQSRSTLSYGSSGFPAGSSTASNALTAVVLVYDGYNASASADFALTVNPLPTAQVASTITSQLAASQSSTNLDDLTAVISIASSMINRVGCSSGNDCTSASAVASDQSLRSSLLTSLVTVVQGDDVSASSVSNVVSNVAGIVRSSSSLNDAGLTTFGTVAQFTLSNAKGDSSIPATLLSGLLKPLDSAITAHAASRRRRRQLTVTSTNGAPAPVDADAAMKFGDSILSSFTDILSRDSAPGVPATSFSFDNFRLAQQTVSGGSSASLSVPLTDVEKAAGRSTSSVKVDTSSTSSNDAVRLSLSQYSSALLATEGKKYSDVLSGQFTAGSTVTVTLANIAGDAGPGNVKAEVFTSKCLAKDYSTSTYTCADSGAVLTHKCTGVSGKLTSSCPVLKTACSNVNLGTSSTGDYTCSVSSITTSTITCQCTFNTKKTRRLDAGDVAQQTGVMNMVAITQFIGNEVDQTFNAAPDLASPAAIEKSLIVIIMYCVMWISGLVMLGGCIYRQRKMKEIRLEQRLEKLQATERTSQLSSVDEVREKLVNYVQAVFPIIFYADHWLVRLKDEIRRNHSYMMLFNSVDGELEDKKRILNGLKLLTGQTALMFLLALLYDLQGPTDDGTCITYMTELTCLAQHSILDNTQNYCVWSPSDNASQPCQFNDTGISFKASLYIQVIVSVFTALLMRPLSWGFDILLAPSVDNMKEKKEEENRLRALTSNVAGDNEVGRERPETKRSSLTALFSNPEEDPELAALAKVLVTLVPEDVEMVSKQAKSYFKRINTTANPIQRNAYSGESPMPDEGAGHNSNRKSLYSKMRSTIAFMANKVMHRSEEETVQILFNELKQKIHGQRAALAGEELAEFDRDWGLDSEGNFLRNDLHVKDKKDVSEIILKEVRKVEHETHEDIKRLKMAIDHHIGLEILHKFILDVLGRDTPAGYIFAGKTEEDFKKSPVRSLRLKVFVSIVLFLSNALFIYYSVLRGYVQGVDWQKQYLVACIIQMVLEIYLFETFECIWINVLIPSLVASEVQRVNRLLLGIIDDICEKAATGEKLEITDRDHVLDATQYLFMSSRLANAYPHLMESMIVRTYHTHLPGELSYKWLATDHSYAAYYRRFFGTHSSETSYMIAAIGAMLATIQIVAFIPFDFQKMIVRFFQPFLFGGLVLLWQKIVASTMGIIIAVVVITAVIVAIVWHYYSHAQSKEGEENDAKITPLDTMNVKNGDGGHVAMQKIKSVRVRSANGNHESSYNSNDITENQSVDSFAVETVRAATAVGGEDDETVDQLHYPVHHGSPHKKKTKKHQSSPAKAKTVKAQNNNTYELVAVPSAAKAEIDLDALINDFKAAQDEESDDGSYRLSLSDHDDEKSDH